MSVTTTSGAIYFSGLGSGTDFDTIINKLVSVEQTRITSLQTWRSSWSKKITAFQALNSQMITLKSELADISTPSKLLTKSVTSSDTTTATATAGDGSDEAVHILEVDQIAQNKIMVTAAGYSNATMNINTSGSEQTFSYVYKGTTYSVTIPSTSSITDVANIVNTDGANPGVKAKVVNDGSKYYLQLWGMDTGSNASLTISASTTLSGFSASNFSIVQNNQDAHFKVDGWPTGSEWMHRASNTITDAISGMTISLKGAGTTSLSTTVDSSAVLSNIKDFVSQVNEVLTIIKTLTKVDTSTNTGSLLTGNYSLQMIQSDMQTMVAGLAKGFYSHGSYTSDTYVSIAQVGITTDATEGSSTEGLLIIDSDMLEAAIASNADAVAKIFSANYIGATSNADISYSSYIAGITKAGTYDVNYTISGGKIVSATINGHAAIISSNSSYITGAAGYDESGLTIKVNNLTDGSFSHKTFLKQGVTGMLIDYLTTATNSTTGPLNVLEDNYNDIIDGIDKKIEREKTRITSYQAHLKDKFSRLDTTLGTYSQVQTQLESAITQLTSSS